MRPMIHPKYDIPLMLYSVVEGAKTFYTQEEIEQALESSKWQMTPNQMKEVEAIKAKILWHKEQLKELTAKYDEIINDDMKKDDDTAEFKCPECGKVCASRVGLRGHMNQHRIDREKAAGVPKEEGPAKE